MIRGSGFSHAHRMPRISAHAAMIMKAAIRDAATARTANITALSKDLSNFSSRSGGPIRVCNRSRIFMPPSMNPTVGEMQELDGGSASVPKDIHVFRQEVIHG